MSGSLLSELKRRNVLRVAMAYAAVAWLLVQIAETVMPLYGFSADAIRTIVTVLAVGFIPAVILAWVFEWTPEGIQKDEAALGTARRDPRWLDRGIIVTLLIAVTYFAVDKYLLQPEPTHYGDKSIAVLPFDNLSDDAGQDYFGLGIAEEMLNLLSRIPELRVISRTSSFELFDQGFEIPEIAERLDVAHVLEGSVRRAGNRLRITAQLIEGATDTHIWSATWDREIEDVFAIQDEIADEVVRRLEVIIAGEMPRSERTDPLAWDLLLQSREFNRGTVDDDPFRALELVQEALQHDPDYIPALLQLNYLTWNLKGHPAADVDEMSRLERYAYHRAVELQPDHPEVLARRAWDQFELHHNWQEAARLLERAVAAAPADSNVLFVASSFAHMISRFDIATSIRLRMLEIDPLCAGCMYRLMRTAFVLGELDEALEWHESWRELGGGSGGYMTMAKIYLYRGELELAMREARQWPVENGQDALVAMILYAGGQEEEALALLNSVDVDANQSSAEAVAEAAAWMGQADLAFEALEAAYGGDDYQYFFLGMNDPTYDSLHDDPRWRVLLEKIKLTDEQRAAIVYNPVIPD
jgi:adenylate cyclase